MDANYSSRQTPQFRVLSDRQVERIYQATLECLNRTGVEVRNAEARALLAGAGARVEGTRVRIPPHIIQDAVAATPRSFTLWGRDGLHRINVVPDRVFFGPGPTCTFFVDPVTHERRMTRRGDPGLTARTCDALANIDFVMSLGLIGDVPERLAPVYEFAEMVANTCKPVLAWAYSVENVRDIYDMALAVAGDAASLRERPLFAFFATYGSPLVHTDEDLANSLLAVERDVPLIYIGGGCAGTTAPITGAGGLVIYLAGALSGLAIFQLKKRGAPVCIGGVPEAMDLATARVAYGSPETSLYSAAAADIGRWLGLPFMGTAGASEAKTLDVQAAIEGTVQTVMSALSGATLVHDVGFLDCAQIGSLEALVMNDEIIGLTRRIMAGIEVSDDDLMLDLIDEIGPGGNFLAAESTARRCRSEIWNPSVLDRKPWDVWQATGARTAEDRIRAKLDRILARHVPPALPKGAAEKIAAVLQAAEQRETARIHSR
jgi:trimethylamine---corrinoid protein Co-methyltransferase